LKPRRKRVKKENIGNYISGFLEVINENKNRFLVKWKGCRGFIS